jgi:3-deoxy-7-phosphoheptulonate synthase
MLIVMEHGATPEQIEAVVKVVRALGFTPQPIPGQNRVAIGVLGNQGYVDEEPFRDLPGIQELIHVTKPYKLVSRDFHPADTVVRVGGVPVGWGEAPVTGGARSSPAPGRTPSRGSATRRSPIWPRPGGARAFPSSPR